LGIINFGISYTWLVETKNVNLDKVKLETNAEEELKMLPVETNNLEQIDSSHNNKDDA
jgi:hypothetical protein